MTVMPDLYNQKQLLMRYSMSFNQLPSGLSSPHLLILLHLEPEVNRKPVWYSIQADVHESVMIRHHDGMLNNTGV